MVKLLEQEFRVVENIRVVISSSNSTLFGLYASMNLCLILGQGCKLVIIIVAVK